MFTRIGLPAGSLSFSRRLVVLVAALALLIGVAAGSARTPTASAQCWGCVNGWNGGWNNWIGGTVWGNPFGNAYLNGYPYFFNAYPYYNNYGGYSGYGYGGLGYGYGGLYGNSYGYGGLYGNGYGYGYGSTIIDPCPPIPYPSCNFGGYPGYGPYSTYAPGLTGAVLAQGNGTPQPVTVSTGSTTYSGSSTVYSTGSTGSGQSCTYANGVTVSITVNGSTVNVTC